MNRVLQLDVNKKGRDFVIGDIHGKYRQLMKGLERVGFDYDKDRLIAVGDLVDRGDQNMQCLKLVFENWFYTVIGNHEMMMADGVTEGLHSYTGRNLTVFWTSNGGHWYYTIDDKETEILKDIYAPMIYNELPVGIELTAENGMKVAITHAGLPKGWGWNQTRKHLEDVKSIGDVVVQNCLWTRDRINNVAGMQYDILGCDLLINGHTPSRGHAWRGNNVFIDLGYHNPYQLIPINVADLLDELQERDATEVEVE